MDPKHNEKCFFHQKLIRKTRGISYTTLHQKSVMTKLEDDILRWRTIKEWAGKGNKQTETFEVTNHEWQLKWAATNEKVIYFFVVMLYKENGQYVSMPVNQTGEGDGSTYVRGAENTI